MIVLFLLALSCYKFVHETSTLKYWMKISDFSRESCYSDLNVIKCFNRSSKWTTCRTVYILSLSLSRFAYLVKHCPNMLIQNTNKTIGNLQESLLDKEHKLTVRRAAKWKMLITYELFLWMQTIWNGWFLCGACSLTSHFAGIVLLIMKRLYDLWFLVPLRRSITYRYELARQIWIWNGKYGKRFPSFFKTIDGSLKRLWQITIKVFNAVFSTVLFSTSIGSKQMSIITFWVQSMNSAVSILPFSDV